MNLVLFGVGPQAKRIYLKYIQKVDFIDKVLIVDLKHRRKAIEEVVNKFDFSVNTPEKVEASVSEELMQDDNIALFNDILNSEMNMKVEDNIIQALNTTQCTANNFVAAIEQLGKKHLRNLTAIVPYSDFIDDPQQYNYNGKINVIPADVPNVFIGDLKYR